MLLCYRLGLFSTHSQYGDYGGYGMGGYGGYGMGGYGGYGMGGYGGYGGGVSVAGRLFLSLLISFFFHLT